MYMVSAFNASGPEAIRDNKLDSPTYVFGSDCEDMPSLITQIAEEAAKGVLYNHYAIADLAVNTMFLFITKSEGDTLTFELVFEKSIGDTEMAVLHEQYTLLHAASYANQ